MQIHHTESLSKQAKMAKEQANMTKTQAEIARKQDQTNVRINALLEMMQKQQKPWKP